MDKNLEKVKLLARDLRDGKQFPAARAKRWPATYWRRAPWTNVAQCLQAGKGITIPTVRSINAG